MGVLIKNIEVDVKKSAVNVSMNRCFTNKNFCLLFANELIAKGLITNMTKNEIAQELYAHAFCYYWYNSKGNKLHSNSAAKELYLHGKDGIYIESGGDTLGRKMFYMLVWRL